jgi:hypothetical protein
MREFDLVQKEVERMRQDLSRAQEILVKVAEGQERLLLRLLEKSGQVELLRRSLEEKKKKGTAGGVPGNGTSKPRGSFSKSSGGGSPLSPRQKRRRKGGKHGNPDGRRNSREGAQKT